MVFALAREYQLLIIAVLLVIAVAVFKPDRSFLVNLAVLMGLGGGAWAVHALTGWSVSYWTLILIILAVSLGGLAVIFAADAIARGRRSPD